MSIAAVILAAGGSSRFGQPKQLLDWEGRPLVAHIADVAWTAGLDPIYVVIGAAAEAVTAALAGRPVHLLTNYRWETGLSSSLALGVSALPPEVEAAVFLQADQPLLSPDLLRALVARYRQGGAAIVAPVTAAGERRSPVLFARALFPDLARLSGDVGGRALFSVYPHHLAEVPWPATEELTDVDTPETYAQLAARPRPAPRAWLRGVRGVICDMDGVLWKGDMPLPGLQDFFTFLHTHSIPYQLVTNNASKTPEQYVEKLAQMGVTTQPAHVLTSAQGTADYIAETWPGAEVYVIGGEGLQRALLERSLRLSDGTTAEVVAVGWDRHLSWEKLATATRLIHRGAHFVGTNPDRTYPTETGIVHGNGAQLAALQAATGQTPIIIGKPEPLLYRYATQRMGVAPAATLVIGDRPETDIIGGLRLGMVTALVLSGVTTEAMARQSPVHPTLIFPGLPELIQSWSESL